MFFICTLFIGFCFIVISKFFCKKVLNPIMLFNIIWFFVVLLSSLELNGLYKCGEKTYLIILLGIIGFNFGAFIKKILPEKIKYKKNKTYAIDIKKIEKLLILAILLMVPFTLNAINLMRIKDYEYIRLQAFVVGGDIIPSVIFLFVLQWIIEPILYTCQLILIFLMFNNNKFNINLKKTFILIITLTLIHSLTFGGRIAIVRLILFIAIYYFNNINVIKFDFRKKIMIILITSISIFFIMYSGNLRAGKKENIINVTIDYFIGPVIMMNSLIENEKINTEFTFNIIGGIMDIGKHIYNFFGENIETSAVKYAKYTEKFIKIGENKKYNALATMFFVFYIDLNLFSVLLYSSIFGFIIMNICIKQNNNDYQYKIYNILSIYCVVMSVQRWEPLMSWIWFSILLIKILIKKEEKYENSNSSYCL